MFTLLWQCLYFGDGHIMDILWSVLFYVYLLLNVLYARAARLIVKRSRSSIQIPTRSNFWMTTIRPCLLKLWKNHTGTFKSAFRAAADPESRQLTCLGKKKLTNSLFNYTVLFCLTVIHRNTGIKVYSSATNIDVYGSDQNRATHLLKATGASNNVCVDCIISPLGGDKWLLKNVFVIESFIRDSFKTLIHPLMKQVRYEWVIESLIQTNFS